MKDLFLCLLPSFVEVTVAAKIGKLGLFLSGHLLTRLYINVCIYIYINVYIIRLLLREHYIGSIFDLYIPTILSIKVISLLLSKCI